MLKKRVVKVLLPLLFSFCCVFSGFLSVSVFAASVPFSIEVHSFDEDSFITYGSSTVTIDTSLNKTPSIVADVVIDNSYLSSVDEGYYLLNFVFHQTISGTVNLRVDAYDGSNVLIGTIYRSRTLDQAQWNSHTLSLKSTSIPNVSSISSKDIVRLRISCTWPTNTSTYSETLQFSLSAITVGLDGSTSSIIAAINNQTTTLQGSIGQAADDIQQSIEDQYSGDPENEFSVDDVITQHNEKMGVLSFGSDVMLQFLDMFQSANVGTAELTLPGFNITVENVEYSVWPDYSFNFEQLNEWVPALMQVIRVMLPAFVWLMVLRYCINVFEKNFLSNGG